VQDRGAAVEKVILCLARDGEEVKVEERGIADEDARSCCWSCGSGFWICPCGCQIHWLGGCGDLRYVIPAAEFWIGGADEDSYMCGC